MRRTRQCFEVIRMKKDQEFEKDEMTSQNKPTEDNVPVEANPEEKAPAEKTSADAEEAPAEKEPDNTGSAEESPEEQTSTDAEEAATADSAPAEQSSADASKDAKSKAKPIAITAAAVAVIAIIVVIIVIVANANPLKAVELPGNLKLRQFETRDQVTKELDRLQKKNNQDVQKVYDSTVGKFAKDAGLSEEGDIALPNIAGVGEEIVEAFSDTFKQVAGVDEADIIKTDGKYIYCIDSDYTDRDVVEIFKTDGKDTEKSVRVEVFEEEPAATPDSAATADEADGWDYYAAYRSIDDIYVNDDRLIVIGSDSTPHDGSTATRTVTKIYDVSDVDHITLLDTFTQSGKSKSTRMIGDTLYLVSSYIPFDSKSLPLCGRGDSPDELPADSIYTLQDNKSEKFIMLSAVNTRDLKAQTDSKAILGEVKDVYCNEENMYIYADYGEMKKQSYLFGLINSESAQKSQILKVGLTDGVNFIAYTNLDGVIDSSYSLDEYNGNLRVATTIPDGDKEKAYLYVLDNELTTIGSLNNFAPDEYPAAIRYVGDTAYVVAYDLVDPLFTIDLSTPEKPTVMGAAQISGFSSMLVPVDDHTLLGLGYEGLGVGDLMSEDAVKDGFKLVLFDVTDPTNPMIIDAMVYENCSSAVQNNPKALVYNPDRGEFLVPLNEEYWGKIDTEKGEYVENEDNRGGALDFKIEKGRLKEVERCEAAHYPIERCAYVGDYIYMTYRDKDDAIQIEAKEYK